MFVAAAVLSILVAALLAYAAIRKLSHGPEVVQAYARAGVPESWLNALAVTLLVGAMGLLLGILWMPLGVAAAIAVAIYFLVAIAFHIRAGDLANAGTPVAIELLTMAALGLRLAS
ncbi:MAG: DoxX family protein [Solirubrobacterales bacterium]